MKFLLTSIFSALIFTVSFAQQKDLSAKKLESTAAEYYRIGEYHHALQYYRQLDEVRPNQPETNYQIGICIFSLEQKSKSLPYFQKAKKLGSQEPDLDLFIARALHINHRFDEAIKVYRNYTPPVVKKGKEEEIDEEEISRGQREINEIKIDVARYIAMCETGKELVKDSLNLVIENMGRVVNSQYPDYVPVVSADEKELIFTSRRPNTTGGKKDPIDDHYFEDIYISLKDETTGQWGTPQDMGPIVNTELHDACVGLSPNGKKLFIYRAGYQRNQAGNIFVSEQKEDGQWTAPEKLPEPINSDYWEPSASISADEKTLFFSSNRPGGLGGTDIYMVKLKENGKWGEAVNLGPNVNTPYDEDAPYIHPDNVTLFFSSRGHNTMGGYDIFTSTLSVNENGEEEWAMAKNAGYPINTADEDIYFVWSADGTKGYFSSWRDDSYGEKDLYVIHKPVEKEEVVEQKSIVLNNIFFDFDKATLRRESDPELEKLYSFLSQYPELKVEISGHTDSYGSDRYNEKLSQRRAQVVVNYLIKQGIPKERLVAKGYGESKPIETNETDEGRQINRRTELKVIDSDFNIVKAYNNTSITYKNEFTGEITESGRSKGKKQGDSGTIQTRSYARTATYSGVEYARGEKYYVPLQQPPAGALLKPKVHFVHKASKSLTEYSTQRVVEIAEIMQKYPSINIKLVAYADESGASSLTRQRAERRLETVKNMLLSNGANAGKIRTEIQSLNVNDSDPEAEISNRRVEFVVD